MAAVALFYRHGRSLSALVYFLGGLAIVYGLLLGLSVPMRRAVTGACPRRRTCAIPEPVVVSEPEPPPPPPLPPPAPSEPVAEVVPEAKPKRMRRPKPPTG